jgi:toxin-antitoxin system PIN domain toxin
MLLPDVNVLIYAHRVDSCEDHEAYAEWLTALANGFEPFALSSLALSGLVRIVTNQRIFRSPSTLEEVFAFIGELTARSNARVIHPGPHHMEIFEDLCRRSGATAKLAADAQHAAIAIEHGCTMITTDSDFDRFPGLRWRHPLRKH